MARGLHVYAARKLVITQVCHARLGKAAVIIGYCYSPQHLVAGTHLYLICHLVYGGCASDPFIPLGSDMRVKCLAQLNTTQCQASARTRTV